MALLTGALAQRFLYGRSEDENPGRAPNEDEVMRQLGELSRQIAELQEALGKRPG